MSSKIITYHSANSPPEQQWLAFIHHHKEGTIGVSFFGDTEDAVKARVRKFWANEKDHRGRTRRIKA